MCKSLTAILRFHQWMEDKKCQNKKWIKAFKYSEFPEQFLFSIFPQNYMEAFGVFVRTALHTWAEEVDTLMVLFESHGTTPCSYTTVAYTSVSVAVDFRESCFGLRSCVLETISIKRRSNGHRGPFCLKPCGTEVVKRQSVQVQTDQTGRPLVRPTTTRSH